MKVALVGKVIERNKRKGKDGVDKFSIVVEEPGQYPNTFQFLVKEPSALGPADGFAAVGKMVQVTGYLNGKLEIMHRKDNAGTWKNFRMWMNLATIQPYGQEQANAPAAVQAQAEEEYLDDVPF